MAVLQELTVQDLAVIQSARLNLGPGLNVVTGETGAGKSLLVDALGVVLGGRADRDLVRTGASHAVVEAVFRLEPGDAEALAAASEHGAEVDDDGVVVLAREIHRDGRATVCRLNGRAVPVGVAKSLGIRFVELHGQGAQVALMDPARQLALLDHFAGVAQDREAVVEAIAGVWRLRSERQGLVQNREEASQKRDFLAYQVDQIVAASLRAGEEEALVQERELLANAEAIREAVAGAYSTLYEGSDSALDQVARAAKILAHAPDPTGAFAEQLVVLELAQISLAEAARAVRAHGEAVDATQVRLQEVEDRLDVVRELTRKHGGSVDAVLAFVASASAELEAIDDADGRLAALDDALAAAETHAGALAWALSSARSAAATRLSDAVTERLKDLAMERAAFDVTLARQEADDGLPAGDGKRYAAQAGGIDQVEFQVATSPGEEPRSLARVASGGEASRLMLAIASVLAADSAPALVFDEIDAGVGGRTGDVVGRNLWALARRGQVLCVTHLPQIAAYADHHVRVTKGVADGRATTQAEPLGAQGRIEEVAEMLGGGQSSELGAAARLLVEQATGYKLADAALASAPA